MTKNILIAGVGGQGIITTSKIISSALFQAGFDVKKSEIHGLSQRGGSVTSMIRFGEKVYSPIIPDYQADYLVSLEELETLRYLHMCNEKTEFIISKNKSVPISVSAGKFLYPENITEILKKNGFQKIHYVNAYEKAINKFKNPKFANTILTGILSEIVQINKQNWEKAIKENIKEKYQKQNLEAFGEGEELI
ncbi:MAG: indolepyruvate oxidoreductase subunit beta [Candidatus Muiribacteriota bacterium]